MNFLIFPFLGLIFGLPGSVPNPDSQSGSADPIESGSESLFFPMIVCCSGENPEGAGERGAPEVYEEERVPPER
jgi:hypothetical protein